MTMDEKRAIFLTRRLPVGAEFLSDGTVLFRVWAPNCRQAELIVASPAGAGNDPVTLELEPEGAGYFSGFAAGLEAGTRYGFRLDGNSRILPDPASRFQPDGPEGLSQIIDPSRFRWTDGGWRGVEAAGQVVYEMHIGTFTRGGTWNAARAELRELARIGMTVLEIMPVAEFPGRFGWGYDGVNLFSPTRLYGSPDDFRRFVDEAHSEGLGVILDVVYNHFGTVAHTIPAFSTYFRSETYENEWGDSINFDGDFAQPVRDFFLANARYWIEEFHLDGLRFDATQAIHDKSEDHILTALVETVRKAAGPRQTYIVAENEPQQVRTMRSARLGGHGMDAAWNDDFHHSATVRLTGHNEAYYSDFVGSSEEFLAVLKRGFIYQGQLSQWQKNPRGTPTTGLPATAFVNFLQNHDQVANSGLGERIDRLTSAGRLRAMTALWLLAPQTPMFFQGQEFASSAPFLYFADSRGEQSERVARGRLQFLEQFPSLATPEARSRVAEPADPSTFERCRLDFSERESHGHYYALHIDLLRLRREDPVFRRQRSDLLDGAALSPGCFLVRFFGENGDDRLLLVNFDRDLKLSPVAQPLLAPPMDATWEVFWTSNQPEYGGVSTPPLEAEAGWHIPGECTVVLRAARKSINAPDEMTGNSRS